jgi:hypothetical protein
MKKTLIKFPQEYTQSVYGSVAESHDRWRRADGGCLADGLRPTAQAPVAGHLYTGAVQGTCHVNGGREAKNEHTKLTAAHLSVLEGLAASRHAAPKAENDQRFHTLSSSLLVKFRNALDWRVEGRKQRRFCVYLWRRPGGSGWAAQ